MDNLIIITIDSLSFKILNEYPFKKNLFIFREIIPKSDVYTNAYTQGPYTEASVNGLICGQKGLDYGSFLFGYSKCKKTIFDVLGEKGYSIMRYGASNELYEDCQETVYYPRFIETLVWSRMTHFRKLIETGNIKQDQIQCCYFLLLSSIRKTIRYCNSYINKDNSTIMMHNYLDLNVIKSIKEHCLILERKLDTADEKTILYCIDYIDHVFPKNGDIIIPNYDKKQFDSLYRTYRNSLLRCIKKHWPKQKIKVSSLARGLLSAIRHLNIHKIEYGFNSQRASYVDTYRQMLSNDALKKKVTVSFRRRIDQAIDFIENTKDKKFFLYMQPDDFHPYSAFHSYDISDTELVKNELDKALKIAKGLPNDVKCNITTFLSIAYIDEQIERLYNYLMSSGLIENTKIIITADHGNWEYFNANHPNSLVMSEERLHVPLIFYDFNKTEIITHKEMVNLYNFPYLVCEFMNTGRVPEFLMDIRPFGEPIICENMGFGCPDIFNREIHYTIHNGRYKLVVIGKINECIDIGNCVCFSDLLIDSNEEKNLLGDDRYNSIINEYLKIASNRHKELMSTIDNKYYFAPKKYYTMPK